MSYPVDNIIPVTVRISPTGLGTANFASAVLFAVAAERPEDFLEDTYRSYSSMKALAVDFEPTSFTYKAAARWLSGIPATRQLVVWGTKAADTQTVALNKARNKLWWFFTFWTSDVLAVPASVKLIAAWCEENESFFCNTQTGAEAAKIRVPTDATCIATELTALGYRMTATIAHGSDGDAGLALMKHFAAVNYSGVRTAITGEYKKSPGVVAEDVDDTASAAMLLDTKRAAFYTIIDNQGSKDMGRWINTKTHSAYGEFIDDVINLSAFTNAIKVALYNMTANQVDKLGQDPVGQAMLIGACRTAGVQYIGNGYLGPRNYIDPDDGITKYTSGFEILTQPEEILDLNDADRDARKSAPLRIRLFKKGAIHIVEVTLDVL